MSTRRTRSEKNLNPRPFVRFVTGIFLSERGNRQVCDLQKTTHHHFSLSLIDNISSYSSNKL